MDANMLSLTTIHGNFLHIFIFTVRITATATQLLQKLLHSYPTLLWYRWVFFFCIFHWYFTMSNILLRKTPRGWIQIGESRWEVARESREGFSPSGILATPRVRDSPIWIQPRGVFRINPTPGS